MRKLASIRKIDEIRPIKDADAIECAVLGGWTVVVKKGEYQPDDMAVYCEIDSWIPTELAPFLSKGKEPREFEGIKGERLRTVRLRGQLSQGLLLPESVAAQAIAPGEIFICEEGSDVTEVLGIKKWEAVLPAQLAGEAKGLFPSLIPRTDQERVQNLVEEVGAAREAGSLFEISEKLEGSSMTVYRIQGEFGVCSRNLDLRETEGNAFWATARAEGIESKMIAVDEHWDFALQGELIGPGIQGNIYKLSKPEFQVFDVYNIQTGKYLNPRERRELIERMGLNHVPIIYGESTVSSVDELLAWAENKSCLNDNQEREGIVLKQTNGGMSFKAISNKYLLGEK